MLCTKTPDYIFFLISNSSGRVQIHFLLLLTPHAAIHAPKIILFNLVLNSYLLTAKSWNQMAAWILILSQTGDITFERQNQPLSNIFTI